MSSLSFYLVASGIALFHPIPNDRHDRVIAVRLGAAAVEVDYRLEMDEARAALDLPRSAFAGVASRQQFHEAVERFHRPILGDNLDAQIDGQALEFSCTSSSFKVTDHLQIDFHYRAIYQLRPGQEHEFRFREGNYELEELNSIKLTLQSAAGVQILARDETLLNRAPERLTPADRERLRHINARFIVTDHAAESREWAKPVDPVQSEDHSSELLHLLLDTKQGLSVLLLLAAGFGAAHALTPGHGKTLAAAYLVGERGTVTHAFVLGLVTTLTHTISVLLLAALLPVFFPGAPPAELQMALGLIGGLIIAGLGLWLLLVRLAGQADHVHLPGTGHHHHAPTVTRPGWLGVVLLGISGGIVPCWDALAMLVLAISAQRLWLALPLLLAFSAGLASVLVVIGISVVKARDWAGQRWGTSRIAGSLERWLPLASAATVTMLGLWLCYASVPR